MRARSDNAASAPYRRIRGSALILTYHYPIRYSSFLTIVSPIMGDIRPHYIPPPYQDSAESGRLILRDGTTATIRIARPDDREGLEALFHRLSPASKRRRFFSAADPSAKLVDSLCDNSDPRCRLSLVVLRNVRGAMQIIASGSYLAKDQKIAEVAIAVDDRFQGKGLGTLLLERLALLAVRHGFVRFWALTQADNQPMLDVLRTSGFPLREKVEGGYTEVDLSLQPPPPNIILSE